MNFRNVFSRVRRWLSQFFAPRIQPVENPTEPFKPIVLPEDWLSEYARAALYGDEAGQDKAIQALIDLCRASIASLLEHLQSPDPFVRAGAIRTLIEGGFGDVSDAVRVVVQEYDDTLYREVIEALHRIRIPTDYLLALLEAANPRVRSAALELLGRAGEETAARTITRIALHEDDDEVRAAAILALAQIRLPQSVESLRIALHSSDGLIVRRAGEALLRIGTPEAKQAIRAWRAVRFGSSEDYVARREITGEFEQVLLNNSRPVPPHRPSRS